MTDDDRKMLDALDAAEKAANSSSLYAAFCDDERKCRCASCALVNLCLRNSRRLIDLCREQDAKIRRLEARKDKMYEQLEMDGNDMERFQ